MLSMVRYNALAGLALCAQTAVTPPVHAQMSASYHAAAAAYRQQASRSSGATAVYYNRMASYYDCLASQLGPGGGSCAHPGPAPTTSQGSALISGGGASTAAANRFEQNMQAAQAVAGLVGSLLQAFGSRKKPNTKEAAASTPSRLAAATGSVASTDRASMPPAPPSRPLSDEERAAQRNERARAEQRNREAEAERKAQSEQLADERARLYREQQATQSAESGPHSSLNDIELLEVLEEAFEIPRPNPTSEALDAILDQEGIGTSLPTRTLFSAAADRVKETVVELAREGTGKALCGGNAGGESDPVTQASEAFWVGVCGGWVGRPWSPSGVYGYLKDEVLGKFNNLFDRATESLGLMPIKP